MSFTRDSIKLSIRNTSFGSMRLSASLIRTSNTLCIASNQTRCGVEPQKRRRGAEKLLLAGRKAFENGDLRTAEREFRLAESLDSRNQSFAMWAEISSQNLVHSIVQQAEDAWKEGKEDRALASWEEALQLDSANQAVTDSINRLMVESSLDQFRPMQQHHASEPISLTPRAGLQRFRLRTDKRALVIQVFAAYGIGATVDSSVNGQVIHFETEDIAFDTARELLTLATHTFAISLDPKHVLVVADTRENRSKFEPQVMRVFYLPGLNSAEMTDGANIARNILGLEPTAIHSSSNSLTVRAPASDLEMLNELYGELFKGRSVIQLDIRLYEIDKTKVLNAGVILPGSATVFNVPSEINNILKNNSSLIEQLLKLNPALAGNYESILAALIASGALSGSVFNSPFAVFGGGITKTGLDLPTLDLNMLLNSVDARSFLQQKLRVLDQEEAKLRSGQKFPILTSRFSSLSATASSSSGTIPQFQYQDLGLTLKVIPRIESNRKIALSLEMKISSLTGTAIDSVPVLGNREFSSVVFLGVGESAILVSDLSKQESKELTGIPSNLFSATDRQDSLDSRELVIVITPSLIRLAHDESHGPMLMAPKR